MITKNLFVLFLFLTSACSTGLLYKEDFKNPSLKEWSLIEKMEQEKWDVRQLKKVLGEPNRQYQDPFFIVYDYDQPNHQKWGFKGEITFNPNQPDSTMKKLMDVSRIHSLGWKHDIDLQTGLKKTIDFFLKTT